jgi:cytochrome P450
MRRSAQSGYFTAAHVASFDPQLEAAMKKLVSRLEEFKQSGQPANLSNAFRSLATDNVTEFAFHRSYDFLDSPDFAANFNKTLREFAKIGMWHRHFGLILDVMQSIPPWIVAKLDPSGVDVLNFFQAGSFQLKSRH